METFNNPMGTRMPSSDRDQRLAAKLRENLRRRKAQAKARAGSEAASETDGPDARAAVDAEKPRTGDDKGQRQ